MAKKDCIPYGSDASAGSFKCVDCDYELSIGSVTSLPVCPNFENSEHSQKCWQALSGHGDAPDDPQSR